jgi:hypothetical protein
MKWQARIYRGGEAAKLPVDGANNPDEVFADVVRFLKTMAGALSFEKAKTPSEFNKSTRFRKINGVSYAIIIEQTG